MSGCTCQPRAALRIRGGTAPSIAPCGVVGFPGFAPGSPSPMRGVLDHRASRTHRSCLGLRVPISRGRLLNYQPVCPPHRYVARACDTTVCALRPTGLWAVVYLWRALGLHAWGRTSLRRPQPGYQGLEVNLACPGGLRVQESPGPGDLGLILDGLLLGPSRVAENYTGVIRFRPCLSRRVLQRVLPSPPPPPTHSGRHDTEP